MSNPFDVVRQFEAELCKYTGAPFAVTTTSCTAALMLAVAWHLRPQGIPYKAVLRFDYGDRIERGTIPYQMQQEIEIPKRTYVGVPMSIIHAGGRPTFRDEEWIGSYRLKPLPVWDCARIFTGGMWDRPGGMACVSFHWSKTLGIQQGGAILHDDPEADKWLRMARFDGRQEGVHPKDQKEWIIGHHCYMAPETAAAGLVRLANLPRHNAPLPWGPGTDSDYPALDQMDIFK